MSLRYTIVRPPDILGWFRSTLISANFPPPPDLTPYLVRADDQYVAGGGFGDVYKCWYHGNPSMEVSTVSV